VRLHLFYCAASVLVWSAVPAAAQEKTGGETPRKEASAAQVPAGSIRVDGRLDEETWLQATPITDFVQKEPTEGAAPTDAMEVRFVFDESALYVGARMSTRNAPALQAPLGRRDNSGQAENIQVWLDTFLDRRTAAMFGVTASGVRLDRLLTSDNEDSGDSGFDPVWEAKTAVGPEGWTAELWIPFSQLRFNPQRDQIWGINVRRFRPTLEEEDYWVLIPRTERVFISRFGDLQGISGVRPTRRIELLPYFAQASKVNASRDAQNPFETAANLRGRVGADMKMGLGPNLTLEATVNPDFGQVEADPAEVNLTAFETRFQEKRPFFLEGSQLFSISHPNFYYSRRVGAKPIGPASGDYVDYPSDSTILAAAKLTGRLPSKTSVAFLTAATDEEFASTASLASIGTTNVRVTPRGLFNVGRVRQEFGPLGNTVGFIVTYLHRDLSDQDPLSSLLTHNALAYAGDTNMRFKGGEYEWRFAGGGSYIEGEPKSIERFQRSSSHYAQRPDRTYSPLDPTLTSLAGWTLQSNFDRVSGRHWLWGGSVKVDSENFETNDVANLNGADGMMPNWNVQYRETRPNRVFRSYSLRFNQQNDFTLRGLRQGGSLRPQVNVTWANFWTSSLSVSRNMRTQSVSLTRGGPLMQGPAGWSATANIGNRSTANTRWSGSTTIAGNEDGGSTRRVSTSFSFRPGPRWQLSADPSYELVVEPQQYVTTITGGGRPETYNNRYVFAYIDRSTLSTEFRMGFTVRPDVNLDIYAEPFAASGRYYDFGELVAPRTRDRITYGTADGTSITTNADGTRAVTAGDKSFTLRSRDFNTLSFRSNVVLRWEWRPGSTLFLVWQMDRSNTDVLGSHVGFDDMFSSVNAPGPNFFVIKTSFWLPIR
jgi:uncharacterized protein DUF5916